MKKLKLNKKKCDQLFSELIRKAGKCHRCGSIYRLQCAHIFTRGYYTIRWDIENAVCLCSKCHVYFTYKPIEWEDYIKPIIGEDKWRELRQKALTYQKIDYETIYNGLVGQLELLK